MTDQPAATDSARVAEVPAGRIHAYVLPGAPKDVASLIRPCRPKREWMDKTPANYAYRCIPLTAANTMGWEILNPVNCEFRWNGLTPQQQVFVYRDHERRYGPKSHFGTGVVTWELPFLFRTPPDHGLVVTGPANQDKAGIVPLDGFIRTDWLPFPFTMNWRITRPDTSIRFDKGEPIARVFPYPLALLQEMEIELKDLSEDPVFADKFQAWGKKRQQNYQEQAQTASRAGVDPAQALDQSGSWNQQYAKGQGSDAAAQVEHQTIFACKPVKDGRK